MLCVKQATIIPKTLKQAEKKHSLENIYFAAVKLVKIFGNVLALPESSNFRSIDISTEWFKV